jgi:iron-sulfur cluster protein
MIERFPERYRAAIADDGLRRTLLEFQRTWRASRDRAAAAMDFEAQRQLLVSAKDEVIRNLPDYVNRFQAEAERQGATVLRAAGAEDAASLIRTAIKDHGARTIVKSKSMVSEEIDLNEVLENDGFHVVETDLGEWIVQLAGERPSHIVGPALHMNRRQIAQLFARATGKEVSTTDIAEQVAVAREALREEFLAGDVGISGANALVVEAGSVMLVTNEGNAELVTSIPRLHIVLAGIEKIVPTVDDAMTLLSLLAPTATGQPATTYVSFIAPPSEPGRKLVVVLLDNGRNAMRESPLFVDALRCIRCGACSSVCPSYGAVGGHVFGYVYSGAIGLVNTPFHHGLENAHGPVSLCVSCNACQTVCPVDIPLPRQILDTREEVVARGGLPFIHRMALDVWSRPRLFALAARAGSVLQNPVKRGAFLHPPLPRSLTSWRLPPALARRPFRDSWVEAGPDSLPGDLGRTLGGLTIAYFVQCITDWLYPEMGNAIVDVLRGLGATVIFPGTQHCCGLPALDSGAGEIAQRMARQTIESLESCRADYILSGGTSCVVAMAHEYPHLFRDDPQWRARAERLAGRVLDFTTFLHTVARLPDGALTGQSNGRTDAGSEERADLLTGELHSPSQSSTSSGSPPRATYHYFCQSYNVLGFRDEPLRLLRDICGQELVPLPEANVCCGFGGSVSINNPEMCSHILQRKLDNVDAAAVPLLITDNPGCIMHLRGGIAASHRSVRVKHTAEIVASRIRALKHGL